MEFDYVIVGGGSAGCVLAARLSEDPSVTVVLIEAGGNNDRVLNRVPTGAALHIVKRNACNWAFSTVPQRGFNGRRGYQPRGRGLGGWRAMEDRAAGFGIQMRRSLRHGERVAGGVLVVALVAAIAVKALPPGQDRP